MVKLIQNKGFQTNPTMNDVKSKVNSSEYLLTNENANHHNLVGVSGIIVTTTFYTS